MGKWLDVKGPVIADTVYCDGVFVAKDVEFTLPEITFKTATIQAMGDMDVPLIGLLNTMELAVTKVGIDNGFNKLNSIDKHSFEFRWVQSTIKSDGSTTTEGCKAFVRTLPASTAGIGVKPGEAVSTEHKYGVTRMQIYVNGKEILLVDRLSSILRVNGKNYTMTIDSYL